MDTTEVQSGNWRTSFTYVGIGIVLMCLAIVVTVLWEDQDNNGNQTGSENTDAPPVVETSLPGIARYPELENNAAYLEFARLYADGRYEEAVEYVAANDLAPIPPREEHFVRYLIADAKWQIGDIDDAIGDLKELIGNAQVEHMLKGQSIAVIGEILLASADQAVFDMVFTQEPLVLEELLAPADAQPTQFDATLQRLFQSSAERYGHPAMLELLSAQSLLANNGDLIFKLQNECLPQNQEFLSAGCTEVALEGSLINQEPQQYMALRDAVSGHLERAKAGIERIEAEGGVAELIAATVLLAGLQSDALFLKLGNAADAKALNEEALALAQQYRLPEQEVLARVNLATILAYEQAVGNYPNIVTLSRRDGPAPDWADTQLRLMEVLAPVYESTLQSKSYEQLLLATGERMNAEPTAHDAWIFEKARRLAWLDDGFAAYLEKLTGYVTDRTQPANR